MALGSQSTKVELMTNLTNLTHDIFVGQVQKNVRRESPTAQVFQEAGAGDYRLEGQHMVFAADLTWPGGALATGGDLPDHFQMDAVQGRITPVRRYRRIALDNLVELQASGPGAFENLGTRIVDLLWESWKNMEIRHAIGASSGLLCQYNARTSSTVFTVYNGYGDSNTNPLLNLTEGMVIMFYSVSNSAVGGASQIAAGGIAYSTKTITVTNGSNWEHSFTPQNNDGIYAATTNDSTKDYFDYEKSQAPNGVGTIVDPTASISTAFNIAEGTYPRWKPFRQASVTFDHLELTEFWLQLGQKRGFKVDAESDVCLVHPSGAGQIARSLMGFQQQINMLGGQLEGGWTGLRVAGIPIMDDGFFYQATAMTLHTPALWRVTLGGEADFKADDGSQWQRILDYDGKEAYVGEYMNFFSTHRGASGALTSISTDYTSTDNFAPIPNY